MAADPARIGFITEQWRLANAGPDQSVVAKYGTSARDTTDPVETFFDNVADAQAMADERLTLLSPDRRRFSLVASGAVALPDALDIAPMLPTVTVIDDERSANFPGIVVELGMDFEADNTTIVAWG